VRVLLDGVELKANELNVARRAELGQHAVEATAPGKAAFRRQITLTEGANEELAINMLDVSPAAPPVGARIELPQERPASSARTVATWALAGTSVALAATSVGFFLNGRSVADKLERGCSRVDVLCQGRELESARDRNYVVAGVAGGLAAVGAGAALWVALSGSPGSRRTQQAVASLPGTAPFQFEFLSLDSVSVYWDGGVKQDVAAGG
jgi:hypothetical protein